MARIRTVKPELFRHEDLFNLEKSTGLPIRISWVGLFTAADREGRFRWKPKELKLDVLPHDEIDFSEVLYHLVQSGFLIHYKVGNREFGCIPTFKAHQVINNKEKDSDFPSYGDPKAEIIKYDEDLSTRASRVTHACLTPLFLDQGEGKGREGKGREGNRRDGTKPTPIGEERQHPLVKIWNEHRGKLTGVRGCGSTRMVFVRARWDENPSEAFWVDVIQRLALSPFCNGSNPRRWKADFDFLIRPETAHRTLEGKYDDSQGLLIPKALTSDDIDRLVRGGV